MTTKVYIQAHNGFPLTDWMISAFLGFRDKGTEIILFEEIDEVPASRYNLVVAYMDDTFKYFERVGIPAPISLNVPTELEPFLGRIIQRSTMATFKSDIDKPDYKFPIFIKPDGLAKTFIAGVVSSRSNALAFFKDVPDDIPVLLSEVVDFVSEYRGYVIEGELVGLKHYLGDLRIFPDVTVIDAAIAAYKSQPVGYSIDFGVTKDGRTLLIECNDGRSLGNYGLDDKNYTKLLARRWRELMSYKQ